MRIYADFAGGNIQVEKTCGDVVYLSQQLRDTGEWWFYWQFAVEARPGTFTFVFNRGEVVGPFGPAVLEPGKAWRYAPDSTDNHSRFTYTFSVEGTYRFAFCIPYTVVDFEAFYREPRKFGPVTEGGRKQFYLEKGAGRPMLFTCRHHACEAAASYVLEGVWDGLGETGLTDKYKVVLFPFVDLDGVEEGDQGKSRLPHDHNRDYTDRPLYAAVRFLCENFSDAAYFFDLHCPGKWGGIHDKRSLIGLPTPQAERQMLFSSILQETAIHCRGGYSPSDDLAYGTHWNTGKPASAARRFAAFGANLALSFEQPFFGSVGYLPDDLRDFGRAFIQAVALYDARRCV